ncbi:pleckstrin homology domain-containing family G member 7-like [Saccoglossus kowalevskii]
MASVFTVIHTSCFSTQCFAYANWCNPVFLEPLKDTQCEGHLMFIEPSKLFGNLDELCQVSLSFCKILEHGLSRASRDSEFGKTEAIVSVFYTFRTRVCPAYQRYCLNYSNALSYMERLRKQTDFLEFVKWCEQDVRCKRLQLSDLLVAPIQHITKYPLLLKNIRKKTQDQTERGSLSATIQSVESCLREMEGKVKWLTNFERLRELQQLIAWPSVDEMDSKSFIPEFLRSRLNKQSCNTILTSPKRTLLHEGPMLLSAENAKSMETYLFLLDDVLLVTKMRKISKKKSSITGEMGMMSMSSQSLPHKKDGVLFTVCKQPISVDRMEVIEVEPQDANGLKHAFVILHINRYQQVQTVLTFQAGNSNLRNKWLTHLRAAKLRVNELARHKGSDNPETQEKRSSKGRKKTL